MTRKRRTKTIYCRITSEELGKVHPELEDTTRRQFVDLFVKGKLREAGFNLRKPHHLMPSDGPRSDVVFWQEVNQPF